MSAQPPEEETRISELLVHCDWLDRAGARDSSLMLLQRGQQLAWKAALPRLIAEAGLAKIRHFNRYQLRDSLESNLDPLIDYAAKNNFPAIQAEAFYFKATHWLETQRYKESLEFCEQGIEIARKLDNDRLKGLGLLCKGAVLRTSENDSKLPLPYFYQAFDILQHTSDTAAIIRSALLITSGEDDAGKKTALLNFVFLLAKNYTNEPTRMGMLLFKAGSMEPEQAIPVLEEALGIARKLRIPNMIQHLYLQLAGRYEALKQYDLAISSLDQARAAFPNNLPDDGALNYYEIYKEKGDFQKAVQYMERFREYEDVRKQTDMRSFVTEWETKMNTREKEWELQEKKRALSGQRTRNLLLSLVLLLVFVAGSISVYAFLKQKKARKQLSVQHELIVQQADELKSLEKLKSRFFANVSHELRTPLTLMLGPATTLLKSSSFQGRERSLLKTIQGNCQQLLKLVNEILDLSKLETGRLELKETPVNLLETLKPIMAQFSSYGDSVSVRLEFDYQAEPSLNLMLDTGKFEKILHNYLSNAFKFTPGLGAVSVAIKTQDDDLLVSVNDTGPGIHPDDLPHVFDRFYQSRQPDAPAQGGTGIGLSLVRELAELMGGTAWVESVYGHGSTFYFRFPMKIVRGETQVPGPSEATVPAAPVTAGTRVRPAASKNNYSILIAEDNAELRDYLKIVLEEFNVVTVENGKLAMDILQSGFVKEEINAFKPDLIISDLMMPVMDGFQLLEWVKSLDGFRHLPFILLTARSDIQVKLRALRVGVDDYILKPFVEEELRARIHNLLTHYADRIKVHASLHAEENTGILPPIVSESDARWLEEVEQKLTEKLRDSAFNLSWVAYSMCLSERQFRRKVHQLTGMAPAQYLQEMRLKMAKDFLFTGKFSTIKETAGAVGYRDTPHFSTLFQEKFGVQPSAYLK